MDDSILLKYDGRAPRYTSYPTAPHFGGGVGAEQYAAWLAALAPETTLSLYLHIPFCRSLCWFCGCQTTVANRYEPIAGYLRSLHREIDLVCGRLGGHRPVSHVHFGGGSPTLVANADFRHLLDRLREHFVFAEDAEIAIEIDPRAFDPAQAAVLAAAGVNRASIGVQDFAPRVQEAINRVQSLETTARALDDLRTYGIERISLDLLYGLPYQTPDGIEETAAMAAELGPDRISLFGYAHVPWMRPHQRLIEEDELPGPGARLALYRAAADGNLVRNFQGYSDDGAPALIGFGASALGTLPQGYVQNAPKVPEYRRALRDGELATVRGIAVSNDDRLRREIIVRLMCDLTADLPRIAARFGADPACFEESLRALAPIEQDGLIHIEDGRITVVPEARPVVRTVCAAFDTYLASNKARHSLTI